MACDKNFIVQADIQEAGFISDMHPHAMIKKEEFVNFSQQIVKEILQGKVVPFIAEELGVTAQKIGGNAFEIGLKVIFHAESANQSIKTRAQIASDYLSSHQDLPMPIAEQFMMWALNQNEIPYTQIREIINHTINVTPSTKTADRMLSMLTNHAQKLDIINAIGNGMLKTMLNDYARTMRFRAQHIDLPHRPGFSKKTIKAFTALMTDPAGRAAIETIHETVQALE